MPIHRGLRVSICLIALTINATSLRDDAHAQEITAVKVTLSPAAEPIPVLKYRFTERPTATVVGNAAPIYLRLIHELPDGSFTQAKVNAAELLNVSDQDFSPKDAAKVLEPWQGRLELLRLGSLRKECDWDYPVLEQREDVIAVLLPDAQTMRDWGRILALQARLQIARGEFDAAAETIATGFRFAQHVGNGPFLINGLVGIANARLMVDQLERWVAAEDSPNIYWAVTSMPRPLISLRDSLETEFRIIELLFPEIDQFEQLSADGEWDFMYRRIVKRINKLTAKQILFGIEDRKKIKPLTNPKEDIGPAARKYLQGMPDWSDKDVDEMSDEQAIVRYVVTGFRDIRDTMFKNTYLPYDAAFRRFGAAEAYLDERCLEHRGIEVMCHMMASTGKAQLAEARMERRLAAIRTLEALRLHLAEEGELPASLDSLQALAIPGDPITGRPFLYQRNETTAELSGWDLAIAFADVDPPFFDAKAAKAYALEYKIEVRVGK